MADDLIQDGIHFGLDKDRYHKDPALGSTDIRNLLVHPADYWWASQKNPMYEYKATKWTDWGSAFHVLICEGADAFAQRYYRGPSPKDYGDKLLETATDLKQWLSQRNMATSGAKEVMAKRVLEIDPDAPVWDKIVEREQIKAGDRFTLKPEDFDSVRLSSQMITKNPICSDLFQNGYPEVSVFWTDKFGVRLKNRYDYLRIRAIVDLKSYRHKRSYMPMMRAIFNSIGEYRLDIQACYYLRGRDMALQHIGAGKVFGDVDKNWLDKLAEVPVSRFVWVFYQASGAPIARRVEWDPAGLYHEAADTAVNLALESFRRYSEVFGEEIWVDLSEKYTLNTEDLPAYLGLYGLDR